MAVEIGDLREALREYLEGKTDAEDRVYDSRIISAREADFPLINIWTPSDLPDSGLLNTNMQMGVFIAAEQGHSVGGEMDVLRRQIRRAVEGFADEMGLSIEYAGRDTENNSEAAEPHIIMTLNFQIETLDEL